MKKAKVLLTLVCAVLLVAASVMGTMAYLTSEASVKNTFTVGNISLGNTNEAGLDEAKTNEAGQPIKTVDGKDTVVSVAEADRVTTNKYKLQPGHSYTKDPTIHVGDSSDDCYLFVKVENGISAIEDSSSTIASQMAAKGWKALNTSPNVYVYVGTAASATNPLAVSKGSDVVVFESFKISGTVTDVSNYSTAAINVTAYAVQTDGFDGKTADQIWDAAFATT